MIKKNSMKKVVKSGWLGMMSIALSVLFAGCGGDKTENKTEEVKRVEKVRTEVVASQNIERVIECTAVLEGYETMNVSPSMTGLIEKRYKDVGDRVSTGDLLVRMDQTQLKQAKLSLANLETEMKRMDALLAGGNVTQQAYDQTKLAYNQAKEQYDFLNNNTFFKATFPGVVSARNYENGELYNGARPILTVVQINVLKAIINVPEAYFTKVRQGMKLDIVSDLYPDRVFPSVIEVIYPTIDSNTHTFQCKVRIPNGAMKLRPGMYVHTTVPAGKEKVTVVPFQSVLKLSGSNDRYVFLNENGFAKRVGVQIGQRFDHFIEVFSEDIKEGVEIVTQGQTRLVDGVQLEVISGDVHAEKNDTVVADSAEKKDEVAPVVKEEKK